MSSTSARTPPPYISMGPLGDRIGAGLDMIDDEADFGDITDAHGEVQTAAKFRPKAKRAMSRKPSKSLAPPNPAAGLADDAVGALGQDNLSRELGINQETAPSTCFGVKTSGDATVCRDVFDAPSDDVLTVSAVDRVSQNQDHSDDNPFEIAMHQVDLVVSDSHGEVHGNDLCRKPTDQETVTVPDALPPQDVSARADLDSQDELINPHTNDTRSIFGEPSAEPTVKFEPKVGRKKGSSRSVSFVLPDASERVAPTDTNSDMSNISHCCNDMGADENLNFPQQNAEKHCSTEELSSDLEYTDGEGQYLEGEPSDHAVEQQTKLDVGKLQLSMKLRDRKKSQKTGISADTAADNFDENSVELLAAEQENDSGDEYPNPAGGKQKARKQRKKEKSKKPLRSSESTSIEESDQQNLQKSKSEVSSRGRKRALKDTSTGQHEKKLTHRICQKRTQEIKTLLEKPDHEIDPMKLSVMHLRLLQEAREHMKSKTIPSGQSSNQSAQFGDTDNFDLFGENYDNDRPENHVQENVTKLNYHSYMNKQTRTKWSKSDTDLFYQGLQQFGSDFAMIQQLFPDKTRDEVRLKFKSEEKKNPMQVHDAILHRSRDNLRLKQVIKQLNIEDVQRDTNCTQEQEGVSHEGNLGNEKALDGSINEEESDTNWSDKEQDTQRSEVTEGENVSANADDGLDVFDWY